MCKNPPPPRRRKKKKKHPYFPYAGRKKGFKVGSGSSFDSSSSFGTVLGFFFPKNFFPENKPMVRRVFSGEKNWNLNK
jgi:hypothetical protein